MSFFRTLLGIPNQTEQDRQIIKELNNSYSSLRVVGRGTMMVDPSEVSDNIASNGFYEKARRIVESSKK